MGFWQAPHRFRVARCPSTGLAVRRCFLSGADIASCTRDRDNPGPLGHYPGHKRELNRVVFCDGPTTARIQADTMFLARHRAGSVAGYAADPVLSNRWLGLACSGEEAAGQSGVGTKPIPSSSSVGNIRVSWFPPPRSYSLCTAIQGVPHVRGELSLALLPTSPQCFTLPSWINAFTVSARILDRHIRIGAML